MSLATDGATLGLAGAAQIIRIDKTVDFMRKGRSLKQTQETVYAATSLLPRGSHTRSFAWVGATILEH